MIFTIGGHIKDWANPFFGQPVEQQTAGTAAGAAQTAQGQFGRPMDQQIPPTGQQIPPTDPQAPQPKKKMKKGALIGIIAGAAALVVAIVLVLLLVVFPIGKVRINLEKYADVEYSGYDGGGKATAVFDRDQFLEDYSDRIKYAKGYEELAYGGYTAAEDLVDFYISYYISSDETGLKNGDEVTYYINVDPTIIDFFNISIKNQKKMITEGGLEYQFTVEGLEEAELFDPFDGLKISYTGVDPYGELQLDWSECPEPAREYSYLFDIDKSYDLKNGDVVTISIDEDYVRDYFFEEYGMAPSSTTYTFTVEGVPVILSSLSEIDATSMSDFEADCNQIVDEDYVAGHIEGISTSSYKLLGCILKVAKEPSMFGGNNKLYAVYEMSNLIENATPYTAYAVYSFSDVGINDGKLSYDTYYYTLESHTVEITAGNWVVTDYYGFTSVDEVKSYFIKTDDASNTYETNLP